MKKLSWLLASTVSLYAGYISSVHFHSNIASKIDTKNPGQISVIYEQVNPGLGKGLGLMFLALSLYSGSKFFDKDESGEGVTLSSKLKSIEPFPREVKEKLPPNQDNEVPPTVLKAHVPDFIEYSKLEDFDIEGEALEPKLLDEVEEVISAPVKTEFQNVLFKMMFESVKKHFLVPAETGAGKTSIVIGAMKYFYDRTNGQAEFYMSTAKPGLYGGLETLTAKDGHSHVLELSVDKVESINNLLDRLRYIRKIMVHRQQQRKKLESLGQDYNPHPIVIILDEWIATVKVAKDYDELFNSTKLKDEPRSNVFGELISIIETFIIIGREDNIGVWLFGQSHQVQNCHINGGYQDSLDLIIPARFKATKSITKALTGRNPVIYGKRGEELLRQANELIDKNVSNYGDKNPTIVYTDIEREEVLSLDYNPAIKFIKIWNSETESHEEVEESNVIPFEKFVG